jgi:hypothetical protein
MSATEFPSDQVRAIETQRAKPINGLGLEKSNPLYQQTIDQLKALTPKQLEDRLEELKEGLVKALPDIEQGEKQFVKQARETFLERAMRVGSFAHGIKLALEVTGGQWKKWYEDHGFPGALRDTVDRYCGYYRHTRRFPKEKFGDLSKLRDHKKLHPAKLKKRRFDLQGDQTSHLLDRSIVHQDLEHNADGSVMTAEHFEEEEYAAAQQAETEEETERPEIQRVTLPEVLRKHKFVRANKLLQGAVAKMKQAYDILKNQPISDLHQLEDALGYMEKLIGA